MNSSSYPRIAPVVLMLALVMLIPSRAFSFGSKNKTPEANATDVVRQATDKYNDGVKHMDMGKAQESKWGSATAWDYMPTKVAKAQNEFRKAVTDFQAATTLRPNMIEAFNNLGFCLRKLDRLQESLQAYDKALAIDSLYAPAREYRGELYLAMGNANGANGDLQTLERIKSPLAQTLTKSIEEYHNNMNHAGASGNAAGKK